MVSWRNNLQMAAMVDFPYLLYFRGWYMLATSLNSPWFRGGKLTILGLSSLVQKQVFIGNTVVGTNMMSILMSSFLLSRPLAWCVALLFFPLPPHCWCFCLLKPLFLLVRSFSVNSDSFDPALLITTLPFAAWSLHFTLERWPILSLSSCHGVSTFRSGTSSFFICWITYHISVGSLQFWVDELPIFAQWYQPFWNHQSLLVEYVESLSFKSVNFQFSRGFPHFLVNSPHFHPGPGGGRHEARPWPQRWGRGNRDDSIATGGREPKEHGRQGDFVHLWLGFSMANCES